MGALKNASIPKVYTHTSNDLKQMENRIVGKMEAKFDTLDVARKMR